MFSNFSVMNSYKETYFEMCGVDYDYAQEFCKEKQSSGGIGREKKATPRGGSWGSNTSL